MTSTIWKHWFLSQGRVSRRWSWRGRKRFAALPTGASCCAWRFIKVHGQFDSSARWSESLFLAAISFSCQPCHVVVTSTHHNGISQKDLAHLQRAWPTPGFFTCYDMLFTKRSQDGAQIGNTKGFDPKQKARHCAGLLLPALSAGRSDFNPSQGETGGKKQN
ncbi:MULTISPECIES: hypothetical protein [unclassified Pseudomonas]|uniref:hypothetical protein n=1 Tax=unclassified Pseudomonas TaxID=196821 RepID=UPI0012E3DEE6|nr:MULTISPECIES: hypothetical protein [unclassified Pseudomonas]